MKRWRCKACGYVHEGAQPPEVCPVCGLDRSYFIRETSVPGNFLRELREVFLLHPVSSHFPLALLPVSALAFVLLRITGDAFYDRAAFYALVIVSLAVPVVLLAGLRDWQRRYDGAPAPVFFIKRALALCLCALVWGLCLWRAMVPELWIRGGLPVWCTFFLYGLMLCLVALLGHFGGKIVYRWTLADKRD